MQSPQKAKANGLYRITVSKVTCETFYNSNEVQLWKGHRLIGVDGSTVELPNSKEIQEKFGVFKYRQDGKAICMGRTLMLYDTLNHMIRQGSLDTMEESETSMLWKAFPDVELKQSDLLIFDRYYASHLTAVSVRPLNEALKRASVRSGTAIR